MRTAKQNNKLFMELENLVDRYVMEKDLFCGGCCYAAAQIARGLDHKGIKYSVVVFQGNDAVNCRSLKSVCRMDGCAHVAIMVNYKHKLMCIGDTTRVVRCLNWNRMMWGEEWRARRYTKVNWRQLEACYYGNEWNDRYDTRNNARFFAEISRIFAEN